MPRLNTVQVLDLISVCNDLWWSCDDWWQWGQTIRSQPGHPSSSPLQKTAGAFWSDQYRWVLLVICCIRPGVHLVGGHPAAGCKTGSGLGHFPNGRLHQLSVELFTQVLPASVNRMSKRLTGKSFVYYSVCFGSETQRWHYGGCSGWMWLTTTVVGALSEIKLGFFLG